MIEFRQPGEANSSGKEQVWRRLPTRLATFLAVVASALAIGGGAAAITSNEFRYEDPKTAVYTLGGVAFQAAESDTRVTRSALGLSTPVAEQVCFFANINIPSSGRVKRVRTYVASNADANHPSLRFIRVGISTLDPETISEIEIPANVQGTFETEEITESKIDNRRYVYMLELCLSQGDFFASAQIEYTYTKAGD
jgi:hypothetical protein